MRGGLCRSLFHVHAYSNRSFLFGGKLPSLHMYSAHTCQCDMIAALNLEAVTQEHYVLLNLQLDHREQENDVRVLNLVQVYSLRVLCLNRRKKCKSSKFSQIRVCLQHRWKFNFFFCDYFREIRQICTCQNAVFKPSACIHRSWSNYLI